MEANELWAFLRYGFEVLFYNVRSLLLATTAMECTHLNLITVTGTDMAACGDCLKRGDQWMHLRMCLVCGYVGCCDSSKNRHARRHYRHTGHPLIRSVEPGENWRYCYEDRLYLSAENKPIRKG